MKVFSKVRIKPDRYEVGDQIKIKLKNGRVTTATCHDVNDKRSLFVFDQVIAHRPMNTEGGIEGGWEESDLRNWLHNTFYKALPKKLKKALIRDEGDYLRLLYFSEVFGSENIPSWIQKAQIKKRLPLMEKRIYRIGIDTDDDFASWWLRDVTNSTHFAFVGANGSALNSNASYSFGVRPAFAIQNLKSPSLVDGLEGETVISEE